VISAPTVRKEVPYALSPWKIGPLLLLLNG